MCEVVVWMKMVDVFFEEDDVNDDVFYVNEIVGDVFYVIVGGNRDEMCEEEVCIEENIVGFVDEEE